MPHLISTPPEPSGSPTPTKIENDDLGIVTTTGVGAGGSSRFMDALKGMVMMNSPINTSTKSLNSSQGTQSTIQVPAQALGASVSVTTSQTTTIAILGPHGVSSPPPPPNTQTLAVVGPNGVVMPYVHPAAGIGGVGVITTPLKEEDPVSASLADVAQQLSLPLVGGGANMGGLEGGINTGTLCALVTPTNQGLMGLLSAPTSSNLRNTTSAEGCMLAARPSELEHVPPPCPIEPPPPQQPQPSPVQVPQAPIHPLPDTLTHPQLPPSQSQSQSQSQSVPNMFSSATVGLLSLAQSSPEDSLKSSPRSSPRTSHTSQCSGSPRSPAPLHIAAAAAQNAVAVNVQQMQPQQMQPQQMPQEMHPQPQGPPEHGPSPTAPHPGVSGPLYPPHGQAHPHGQGPHLQHQHPYPPMPPHVYRHSSPRARPGPPQFYHPGASPSPQYSSRHALSYMQQRNLYPGQGPQGSMGPRMGPRKEIYPPQQQQQQQQQHQAPYTALQAKPPLQPPQQQQPMPSGPPPPQSLPPGPHQGPQGQGPGPPNTLPGPWGQPPQQPPRTPHFHHKAPFSILRQAQHPQPQPRPWSGRHGPGGPGMNPGPEGPGGSPHMRRYMEYPPGHPGPSGQVPGSHLGYYPSPNKPSGPYHASHAPPHLPRGSVPLHAPTPPHPPQPSHAHSNPHALPGQPPHLLPQQQPTEITSVEQWQRARTLTGMAPSANKCMPLQGPIPSKFWGDAEKTIRDAKIPDFHKLVNYPDYLPKNSPKHGRGDPQQQQAGVNNSNGDRHCVMCGRRCICIASTRNITGETNKRNGGGNNTNSSSVGGTTGDGNHNNNNKIPKSSTGVIPTQNKGLCTSCDVTVWIVTESRLEIKWCKGCKNFRPWAAFGDKGMATKCVKCRERQKEKYALQKEDLKKKRKLQSNDIEDGDLAGESGLSQHSEECSGSDLRIVTTPKKAKEEEKAVSINEEKNNDRCRNIQGKSATANQSNVEQEITSSKSTICS